MSRLNYKKMLEAIDAIVETDWGFDIIDGHVDLHQSTDKLTVFKPFSDKEVIEMRDALTEIYQIVHQIHCTACQSDKFIIKSYGTRTKKRSK